MSLGFSEIFSACYSEIDHLIIIALKIDWEGDIA